MKPTRPIRRLQSFRDLTELLDHYESAPGQQTPTLCGWEGGKTIPIDPTVDAPFCPECAAIMKWARGGR